MYSLKYRVTTSCCGTNGRLKLYSALQMMQDCSEMWIESEPSIQECFSCRHMAQLLASRQVEVVRTPRFGERLTVSTSVYEVKPMFGYRNTFIYDADGKPCYRTWSQGVFVDTQTGKLTKIPDSDIATVHLDAKLPMNYQDRRIVVPKDAIGICLPCISVQRNDIDYNQHVNNANYVRIALELLPNDFEVGGLRVEYKVPAKAGSALTPVIVDAGQRIFVTLHIGETVSTIIEFSRAGA